MGSCLLRRSRTGEEMRAKIQVQFQGEEGQAREVAEQLGLGYRRGLDSSQPFGPVFL